MGKPSLRRETTERQRRIYKLILLTAGLWGAITSALGQLAAMMLASKSDTVQGLAIVGCLVVSAALLYFGKEPLVRRLTLSNRFAPKDESAVWGDWSIQIVYRASVQGDREMRRYGRLVLESTPTGLSIQGGKLFDEGTKQLVVERWVSEFADIITYADRILLVYAYKIQRAADGSREFDKVGYVIAERDKDEDVFRGRFFDLALLDPAVESRRDGIVTLWRG